MRGDGEKLCFRHTESKDSEACRHTTMRPQDVIRRCKKETSRLLSLPPLLDVVTARIARLVRNAEARMQKRSREMREGHSSWSMGLNLAGLRGVAFLPIGNTKMSKIGAPKKKFLSFSKDASPAFGSVSGGCLLCVCGFIGPKHLQCRWMEDSTIFSN